MHRHPSLYEQNEDLYRGKNMKKNKKQEGTIDHA
jgi:hypothetical protein